MKKVMGLCASAFILTLGAVCASNIDGISEGSTEQKTKLQGYVDIVGSIKNLGSSAATMNNMAEALEELKSKYEAEIVRYNDSLKKAMELLKREKAKTESYQKQEENLKNTLRVNGFGALSVASDALETDTKTLGLVEIVTNLVEANKAQSETLTKTDNSLQEVNQKLADAQDRLNRSQKELDEINEAKTRLEEHNHDLEQNLEESNKNLKGLKMQLEEKEQNWSTEKENLEKQIQALVTSNQELQDEINGLKIEQNAVGEAAQKIVAKAKEEGVIIGAQKTFDEFDELMKQLGE